jgi:hypothetical protein
MPREKINQAPEFIPCTHDGDCPPIHGEAWPEPEVHVSWTRGSDHGVGFVQVSLDCPHAYVESFARDLEADSDAPTVSVFSPSLDRSAVNRMIQTLRRARDQAYGRDE